MYYGTLNFTAPGTTVPITPPKFTCTVDQLMFPQLIFSLMKKKNTNINSARTFFAIILTFLLLLQPMSREAKMWRLISREMLRFAARQTFIAGNLSWSTIDCSTHPCLCTIDISITQYFLIACIMYILSLCEFTRYIHNNLSYSRVIEFSTWSYAPCTEMVWKIDVSRIDVMS